MRHTLMLLGLLVLSGCNQFTTGASSVVGPRVSIPFTPDISINEVMVAQIDHAAHFIWEAADPAQPAAAIDWQEAEHHAIQIVASRSALSMGGTGVNDAMWIAQRSWREYVNQMNEAALLALASARTEDRAGLARAADMLVVTCEGCHQQYKPSIPTEGLTHPH